MEIRAFQLSDEAAVIGLWQACELVVPWNDPERDIARKMQVNPELFLVGCTGAGVIASVMGGYEGHRGWINYLAVHPDYRRRGHGVRLMKAIEEALDSRGCPKINLQVRASNRVVIAFYESLGYRVDEVVSLGKRLQEDA